MALLALKLSRRFSQCSRVNCLFLFFLCLFILHLASTHTSGEEQYAEKENREASFLKYSREENENENFEDEYSHSFKTFKREVDEPEGVARVAMYDHHVETYINGSLDDKAFDSNDKPEQIFLSGFLLKAIGATLVIKLVTSLLLLFIPLKDADKHKVLLKILLSFASGGLLGDAFLHLIPRAVSPRPRGDQVLVQGHNHDHTQEQSNESHKQYMGVGFSILTGILVFLMVEKFVRFVKNGQSFNNGQVLPPPKCEHKVVENSSPKKKKRKAKHKRSYNKEESTCNSYQGRRSESYCKEDGKAYHMKQSQSYNKNNGNAYQAKQSQSYNKDDSKVNQGKGNQGYHQEKGKAYKLKQSHSYKEEGHTKECLLANNNIINAEEYVQKTGEYGDMGTSSCNISEKNAGHASKVSDIKVSGYLNLAADFVHNFTDGLAIGASFLAGDNIGIVTSVTIFLHEIPHDIGDLAILVQSGYTKEKAVLLQAVTAIGAILGTLCSLIIKEHGDAKTAWILPFTAGGFIYIALVSVIPQLLRDSKIRQSIVEILALVLGVCIMALIAFYE